MATPCFKFQFESGRRRRAEGRVDWTTSCSQGSLIKLERRCFSPACCISRFRARQTPRQQLQRDTRGEARNTRTHNRRHSFPGAALNTPVRCYKKEPLAPLFPERLLMKLPSGVEEGIEFARFMSGLGRPGP